MLSFPSGATSFCSLPGPQSVTDALTLEQAVSVSVRTLLQSSQMIRVPRHRRRLKGAPYKKVSVLLLATLLRYEQCLVFSHPNSIYGKSQV